MEQKEKVNIFFKSVRHCLPRRKESVRGDFRICKKTQGTVNRNNRGLSRRRRLLGHKDTSRKEDGYNGQHRGHGFKNDYLRKYYGQFGC